MPEQPESASPAPVIRPIRTDDAEQVHALRRHPSHLAYTVALPSDRLAGTHRFIDELSADDHVLLVEIDGQLVGIGGLHVGRGKQRHTGSIGMGLAEAWQGQRLGERLLGALLEIADDYLGLIRVELEVFPDNARAIRLYERSGFVHEGRKRKAAFRDGAHADVLLMARVR